MRPAFLALGRAALVVALALGPSLARADLDDAERAYDRGDDATALRELRPLVAKGSPSAAYLLGIMRERGRGGPRDPAEAAKWFRKAADGGNAGAMVALAVLHLRGDGVAQSDALAGDWLKKAAAKGYDKGIFLLGMMRLEGRGGPASDAPVYLRRAVLAGSGDAAFVLGDMLLNGRVVARDPAAAYRLALSGLANPKSEELTRKRLVTLAEAAKKELDPTVARAIAGKEAARLQAGAGQAARRPRTGSGFMVSRVGHVLTNAHVADGCGRIMATVDGHQVAAALLRIDRANDLALLRLAVVPNRALAFREGGDLPAGAMVSAAGYPGESAVFDRLRVTTGRTRELAAGAGPRGEQAITAEVLPGNSGGPLLDAAGHVAGVVKAKRDTRAIQAQAGDAPSEMGFAVPLSVVKGFLAQAQVPVTTAPAGRVLDAPALAEAAAGTVIPLFCLPAGP
uniref:Sel1 repeat protein n=1 Tax=Desulfovibrio sp. U5L TaxID=596152 RepID=I2Q4W1_9BACT